MTEMKTTTRSSRKKTAETKTDDQTATPARPNGKLGQLVERLETADGATLAELSTLTNWRPHTVRAALTRLRQRGFKIRLEARGDRKAYRLDGREG
jgi:hypothetical protein